MRMKCPKKTYHLIFSIILLQCLLSFSLNAQVKNKLGKVNDYKSQQNKELYHQKTTSKTSSKTLVRRTSGSGFQIIRLEFNGLEGSLARRELLLGFSEFTTDGYDYGYDAQVVQTYENDLNLDLEGMNMSIQAYGPLVPEKELKLKHYSSGKNIFSIQITELENIDESQSIYLRDNITGDYFDLSTGEAYEFASEQGSFDDRFELAFQSESQSESKSLSINDSQYNMKHIYYQTKTNKFYAKKLSGIIKKMILINMQGQKILEYNNLSQDSLEEGISLQNIVTDTYTVLLQTDTNSILTKKIVVN